MSILALFGLFRAAKFWTAAVMALVQFIQIYSGVDLGLDQATATAIIGGIGAFLTWLIPNAKPKPEPYFPADYYPPQPKGAGLV